MKKAVIAALIIAAISLKSHSATPYVMCHFNSFTATHSSTPYNVESTHQAIITNSTDSPQKYTIMYQTLVEKNIVHTVTKEILLAPHGTFSEDVPLSKKQTFNTKGKRDASCATFVGKQGDDKMTYIFGGGYINIT